MNLSPVATAILEHLKARESARMHELRRISRMDSLRTRAAVEELCRAGLVITEWNGLRWRLRPRARSTIYPPETTTSYTTPLADDTTRGNLVPCAGSLSTVPHT